MVFPSHGARLRRCNLIVVVEISSPSSSAPRRRARIPQRALVYFLLLVALSSAAWFGREILLRGAAEAWIVSDEASPADAVAIFGGGVATRPFAAAEYYKQGLVKKILISSLYLDKSQTLGGLPSHTDLNHTVLLKLGVPENAIEIFGTGLTNTYEEAVALREWAARNNARNIIVPTEIFSTRRLRWLLKHELAGSGTHIDVPALDDPNCTPADWWKNEKGVIAFQNEVIKYVYYRVRY
jgi:uncharacterized SAM-binding protein YcdF (DUF218 family)